MRYLIVNEKEINPEQFVNMTATGDTRLHYSEMFSLMHFSCVEVSETVFQTISKEWEHKYLEVTKAQAYNGSNFFSEIRPYGKVAASVDSAGYAWTPANPVLKVPIELTDAIKKEVVDFMIYFAKEIIEDEEFKITRPRQLFTGDTDRTYKKVPDREKKSIFNLLWLKKTFLNNQ